MVLVYNTTSTEYHVKLKQIKPSSAIWDPSNSGEELEEDGTIVSSHTITLDDGSNQMWNRLIQLNIRIPQKTGYQLVKDASYKEFKAHTQHDSLFHLISCGNNGVRFSAIPLNPNNLLNQIIDDDEEEEVCYEIWMAKSNRISPLRKTTPVPESSIPSWRRTPQRHSREALWQLAMVTTQLVAASSLAPPKPRPAFCNYLQQCKLIFRNDIDSFSSDLKKTLYVAAFLTGKAFEWVQPYLELVTLYGDPNELRATEYKLDTLTMKDGDHASNYISSFSPSISLTRMGRPPLMFHFRKGLPTRVLDLLAQNTEVFDTLSELIEATLKINT
ncbi:hypothetical protein H4Q26_000088 [Puccinia striiformis f. sp. tritici PST-130]|nr:hypothetical protein H4Q26_000088 [Puccinia striiformis f. sp. tritici PST-130]